MVKHAKHSQDEFMSLIMWLSGLSWMWGNNNRKAVSDWLNTFNSLNLCSRIVSKMYCLLLVLTAAVTQASLQSILHKILTAGPSAFNITSLISQAAQLSTQGI